MEGKVDWRACYELVNVFNDTEEHHLLAKGKEIKRSKDETRGICLQYIAEMKKDNEKQKKEISEDF